MPAKDTEESDLPVHSEDHGDHGGNQKRPKKRKHATIEERVADIEYRQLIVMEQTLEVSKERLKVEKKIAENLQVIATSLSADGKKSVQGLRTQMQTDSFPGCSW